MDLEVLRSPRAAGLTAAISLWVVMFTLGLLHEMGTIYILFGGDAPSNPMVHSTNDWLFALVPFVVTTGLAEAVLRLR